MPPRRKNRKTKRRRKAPQASTAVARVGYSSGLNLLPDKFISKMKWNKSFTRAAGTSDIPTINAYRLTSLFDPEYNADAALQPYGFDQLATYYSHYLVLGAKITTTFIHTAGNPMLVGILTSRDTSQSEWSSRENFINDPQSKYKYISNDRPQAKIVSYYSKKKIYGNQHDDELVQIPSLDPVENYFGHTYMNNAGPGQTQASVLELVEIEFITQWTERAPLAKS